MKIEKKIEEILSKYGVSVTWRELMPEDGEDYKLTSYDPNYVREREAEEYENFVKELSQLLQESEVKDDIIDYVQKIMGNGTMVVETVNESILVKLMEIIGKHMPIEKSYRDIDKDFKWYLEDKNSTNKEKNKTGLISKRAVKVAINNAFKDAFNGYFLDANLTVAENVIANKEGVRERLKRLHKSINKMPVIATDELFKETKK